MPRIATMFFKFAVVFLLLGILMGLQMAISGNHNVIGAHAHSNLLGWVTSAVFGGYYALNPAKAETRLARIHFWIYTISIAVMIPALYLFYIGYQAVEPLLPITSIAALVAVLVFAVVVYSPAVPGSGRAKLSPAE